MSLSCCVSVKFRRNVEDYRGIPEEVTVAIPVGLLQKMIMFIYICFYYMVLQILNTYFLLYCRLQVFIFSVDYLCSFHKVIKIISLRGRL